MTDQPTAAPTLGPCCCGRIKELSEPLIINLYVHERLDEPGAFCGPVHSHDFRDLEAERDRLLKNCDDFNTLATRTNARCNRLLVKNEKLLAIIKAAEQLRTVVGTTVADWAAWDKAADAALDETRKP